MQNPPSPSTHAAPSHHLHPSFHFLFCSFLFSFSFTFCHGFRWRPSGLRREGGRREGGDRQLVAQVETEQRIPCHGFQVGGRVGSKESDSRMRGARQLAQVEARRGQQRRRGRTRQMDELSTFSDTPAPTVTRILYSDKDVIARRRIFVEVIDCMDNGELSWEWSSS